MIPTKAQEISFSDVQETDTFYEFIKAVSEEEIVNGYSDGTFKPNNPITRGQFAKMVVNSFYIELQDDCDNFSDVAESNIFYSQIHTLKCLGFISGYTDGRFGSEDQITRAQATKILYILGKTMDYDRFPFYRSIQIFGDVGFDNSMYFFVDSLASVQLEDGTRIINGYSDGRFGPDDSITRGQISKVILKIREYIVDGGEYNPPKTTFYDTYSDSIVEGTVTNDEDFQVGNEYEIRHETNSSILIKPIEISEEDYINHKSIWDSFADIIPFRLTKFISKMVLIDGHDGISAAVTKDFGNDIEKFVLIINQQELVEGEVLLNNSVHESAHIFTLNETQINTNPEIFSSFSEEELIRKLEAEQSKCKTYFVLSGCAYFDSYIYKFYEEFWTDKIVEYYQVRESQSLEMRKDFYLKYNNEFVSAYSMYSPEEDIAESFLYFVFFEKPEDHKSIINKKLNFFYKYPEAVKLRSEMRERIFGD